MAEDGTGRLSTRLAPKCHLDRAAIFSALEVYQVLLPISLPRWKSTDSAEDDIVGDISYGNVGQSATHDALSPSHEMKPVMRAGCNKHELRNDGCARRRIPVKIDSQAEMPLVWIFLVERK